MKQAFIQTLMGRLSKHRLVAFGVAVTFLVTIVVPAYLARVHAVEDTTPMQLLDLTVSETAIDVSAGLVEVELGGEVFEDLSGFNNIEFFYLSPSGDQILTGDANSDEQFIEETLEFPQYAEPGVWRPTFTLIDEATNSITHGPDDLVNLGFDVDITITSSPADILAPVVSAITIGSASIDTATSSADLTIDITATDDLSGINLSNSQMAFVAPTTGQRIGTNISHVSGNNYTSTLTFPQYSEVGTWTMEMTLADFVTNTELYDAADLTLLSLPHSFSMTGNGDTTPVSVDAFDFTVADPLLTGGAGGAIVSLTAEISDNLAGVASATLTYFSQSSSQIAESTSSTNGSTHQFTVQMPQFASTGTWLPELITSDFAGNIETLTHTDLVNLGYDMSMNISANESGTVSGGGSVTTDTGAMEQLHQHRLKPRYRRLLLAMSRLHKSLLPNLLVQTNSLCMISNTISQLRQHLQLILLCLPLRLMLEAFKAKPHQQYKFSEMEYR